MGHMHLPDANCKKFRNVGKGIKIIPRSDDVMDMDKGRSMEIGKVREGQTPRILKKR